MICTTHAHTVRYTGVYSETQRFLLCSRDMKFNATNVCYGGKKTASTTHPFRNGRFSARQMMRL